MRPLDGIDADVAPVGSTELELGVLALLREGWPLRLTAPSVVSNFGIGNDTEVVVEGRLAHRLGSHFGTRTSMEDTAVSIKHVIRRGGLQDGSGGVSIAVECTVLMPATNGVDGTGVGCAGIASQRFARATVHVNTALTRTREHSVQHSIGAIVDAGTDDGLCHPVAEALVVHEGVKVAPSNRTACRHHVDDLTWKTLRWT